MGGIEPPRDLDHVSKIPSAKADSYENIRVRRYYHSSRSRLGEVLRLITWNEHFNLLLGRERILLSSPFNILVIGPEIMALALALVILRADVSAADLSFVGGCNDKRVAFLLPSLVVKVAACLLLLDNIISRVGKAPPHTDLVKRITATASYLS